MSDKNEDNNNSSSNQSESDNSIPQRFDYTTTDTNTHLEKDKKD